MGVTILAYYKLGDFDGWQLFWDALSVECSDTTRFYIHLRNAETAYYEHNDPLAAQAVNDN
jgi:hypothetical protein